MEIDIQYLKDSKGIPTAVQISLSEWERILNQLKKSEQILKLQTDLKLAFKEVEIMKKSSLKKQNLNEFLNEL